MIVLALASTIITPTGLMPAEYTQATDTGFTDNREPMHRKERPLNLSQRRQPSPLSSVAKQLFPDAAVNR